MLNAVASRAAKQQGMQLALDMSGDWPSQVLPELEAWLATQRARGETTVTMEQFRATAVNVPASHKAWGSLPRIAVAAGLIAPMNHPDGSPVMRRAESVKTHSHPVRVWALPSLFVSPVGARTATSHGAQPAEAGNHQFPPERVGQHPAAEVHGGHGSLSAIQAYHRERAAMGGEG